MKITQLPDELNSNIIDYLNLTDLIKLLNTSKYYWINFYDKFNNHKQIFLRKSLPKHVFNLIENYNFSKIKYLDFDPEFISLDYVDRISIDDVDNPIMFSIDQYQRPCLTFLLNLKNEKNNFNIVHTLFQRYTDCIDNWVFGSYYSNFKIHDQVSPTKNDLDKYKRLVESKILDVDNYKVSLG